MRGKNKLYHLQVKLKLPPRPEKKILSSAIQSMKFNAPETSIASLEEQPKISNGRRRSYRSRSRYSSVIPTLEEEDRMDEEIEMTKRQEVNGLAKFTFFNSLLNHAG